MSDLSEARDRLERVTILIGNQEFDEALSVVLELMKEYGQFAELLSLSGTLKAKLGRDDEAESDLLSAIEKDPNCFSAWIGLGNLYSEHESDDKAREAYRQVLKIDPDEYESLIGLATILYKQGAYEEAEEKVQRAINLDPTAAHGFVILGLIELIRTDYEAGEMYFRRAVELSPEHPMPWISLAIALRMQGKESEAQEIQSTIDQMTAK